MSNKINLNPEDDKPIVDCCPYEHGPKWEGKQDIIYREMRHKKTKMPMFYMQCGICGATGPVKDTIKLAAMRYNMRIVKVYEREEFDKIKASIPGGKKNG